MSIQFSTSVRNARADQIEAIIGTSPKLQIFTGSPPANCATASSGAKLVEMSLPSDWMAAASGGVKVLAGVWTATASASGLAGYYRIVDTAGTTCHMQGLVGQTWAAATAYALGQRVINGGNVYNCTTAGTSAGSGGPTGTGSGITDGTAVWAYVGASDMTLDNTNIASGQTVTANSFSLTEGGA